MPTAKFITTTDFENEPVQIAKNQYTTANLQGFINRYEYEYLRKILGDDLLTRFFADLDVNNVPQSPKYVALLDGTTYLDSNDKYVIYEGLKGALKFFIWTEYVRKSNYKNTIAGMVANTNENSNVAIMGQISVICRDAFNHGVVDAVSANRFIQYFERYDTTASSIVFQSGVTYLVTLPSTLFLKDGDTVTIENVDYIIFHLIDDTSFEIDSATDISDTNVRVDWIVFDEFEVEPMNVSFGNI